VQQTDILLTLLVDGGAGLFNVFLQFVEATLQTVLSTPAAQHTDERPIKNECEQTGKEHADSSAIQ
jgi:hypothetical protein